jgi:hypothetical protein
MEMRGLTVIRAKNPLHPKQHRFFFTILAEGELSRNMLSTATAVESSAVQNFGVT